MDVYVGTSGYSYKAWKGSFYPEDLPDKAMLEWYGTRFRSVEINNTFYRMPRPALLQGWAEKVPEGFRFALKAPQQITHRKRLHEADDAVRYLLEVAANLRTHQGPFLFQLPPRFPKDTTVLRDFLSLLPNHVQAAFEFRHSSWFDEETYELLRRHRAALCIAEEDGVDAPDVATADWGYLRLRRADYDDARLQAWVQWMEAQGWQKAFVFFKHEDEAKGPRFATRFMELVARADT